MAKEVYTTAGVIAVRTNSICEYQYILKGGLAHDINGMSYGYYEISTLDKRLSKFAIQKGQRIPALDGWYQTKDVC